MQCKFMKMETIQYTFTLNSFPAHTLLLQSPHHCGQEPAPLAKHTNSHYYRHSLLWKYEHFHAPQCNISLVFFSCYSGHLNTSS